MPRSPDFVQECPVCGRPLVVKSRYLGRRVTCQHCTGRFVASDRTVWNGSATERGTWLARRAEELLDIAAWRLTAATSVAAAQAES